MNRAHVEETTLGMARKYRIKSRGPYKEYELKSQGPFAFLHTETVRSCGPDVSSLNGLFFSDSPHHEQEPIQARNVWTTTSNRFRVLKEKWANVLNVFFFFL